MGLWLLFGIKKITENAKTHSWYNAIYVNVTYGAQSFINTMFQAYRRFCQRVIQIQ